MLNFDFEFDSGLPLRLSTFAIFSRNFEHG